MVVQGGMGTVTGQLASRALSWGATLHTNTPVAAIEVDAQRTTRGLQLQDGRRVAARVVLAATDPFRTRDLAGRAAFDEGFNSWLDGVRRDGTSLKLNMALRGLPRFSCLPEPVGQHNTTTHLLPEEGTIFETLGKVPVLAVCNPLAHCILSGARGGNAGALTRAAGD